MKKLILSISMIIPLFFGTTAYGQLPANFQRIQLASGLSAPTVMLHLKDGRILIGEQNGAIKVFKNGAVLSTPMAIVPSFRNGERGLGGLALHPNFETNGFLYVYYTEADGTNNVIDRYTVVGDIGTNPTRILTLDNTVNTNHNGGAMLFGPDGFLYVSVGESNVPNNSTNLDTFHGKILRLNANGTPAVGNPYFGTGSIQRQSIWAIGFRNPWTMSLDPLTNRIFINDVGGNHEEINDVTSPDNSKNRDYGWGGSQQSGPEQGNTKISPVFSYPHTGGRCAITNGIFFNPTSTNWPLSFRNRYYYTDWCTQSIWSINHDNPNDGIFNFATSGAFQCIGLSTGIDGDMYFFSTGSGVLYKISYTNVDGPQILQQPIGDHYLSNNNLRTATIPAGQNLSLSVRASGGNPLTYQWLRNGIDIPNQTSSTLQLQNLTNPANDGRYSVRVSNGQGSTTSLEFTLDVSPFSTKPNATITTPTDGSLFRGGQTISYSGTATDTEEGNLPAANVSWEIQFHHADTEETAHWHPGQAVNQGVFSGSFVTLTNGETSPNVWYRIVMYVRDASGLRDTAFVDIDPRLTTITAVTQPAGLLINLNGQSTSPKAIDAVESVDAFLEAVTPQIIGNTKYDFSHWVHGGNRSQTISTPINNVTYTAVYTTSVISNVDIAPVHDAYVRSGINANTAFGNTNPNEIETKFTGTEDFIREAYFTFDLSNVSAPEGAILKVYCSATPPNSNVGIFAVNNTTWDEKTITWSNRPPRQNASVATVMVDQAGTYFSWDVSQYVRDEKLAGRNRVSFAMVNSLETGPQVKWNSKETGTNPPMLSVALKNVISGKEIANVGDFEVNLFPNPVQNMVNLNLNLKSESEVMVSVFDQIGQLKLEKNYGLQISGENILSLDLSSYQLGTYFIQVQTKDQTKTMKLVKK